MSDSTQQSLPDVPKSLASPRTVRLASASKKMLEQLASVWQTKSEITSVHGHRAEIIALIEVGRKSIINTAQATRLALLEPFHVPSDMDTFVWRVPVTRGINASTPESVGFSAMELKIDLLSASDWTRSEAYTRTLLEIASDVLIFCSGGDVTLPLTGQNDSVDVTVDKITHSDTRKRLFWYAANVLVILSRAHVAKFASLRSFTMQLWGQNVPITRRVQQTSHNSTMATACIGPQHPEEALGLCLKLQEQYGDKLSSELESLKSMPHVTEPEYLEFVRKAAWILTSIINGVSLHGIQKQDLFYAGQEALRALASASELYFLLPKRLVRQSGGFTPDFWYQEDRPPEQSSTLRDHVLMRSWAIRRLLNFFHWSVCNGRVDFQPLVQVLSLCSGVAVDVTFSDDSSIQVASLKNSDIPAFLGPQTAEHVESALRAAARLLQLHFPQYTVNLWKPAIPTLQPFALNAKQVAFAYEIDERLRSLLSLRDPSSRPTRSTSLECINESIDLLGDLIERPPDLEPVSYRLQGFEVAQTIMTELSICVQQAIDLNLSQFKLEPFKPAKSNPRRPDPSKQYLLRAWCIVTCLRSQALQCGTLDCVELCGDVLNGVIDHKQPMVVELKSGERITCPSFESWPSGRRHAVSQHVCYAMIGLARGISALYSGAEVEIWGLNFSHE